MNLRNIAGSNHANRSDEELLGDIVSAIAELGRRTEVELDRIFILLRNMDTAITTGIANAVATGQAAADAAGLWEYDDDGNLIPKEPTS
jgi:hypothetical protein